MPPGKKWPTLRVRTTTSTRTDSPRRDPRAHAIERPEHLRRRLQHRLRGAEIAATLRPRRNVLASCGSAAAAHGRPDRRARRPRTRPKTSTVDLTVAQELLHCLELRRIAVDERHRRVRRRKAMRPHHPVLRRRIVRGHERHVAVGALLRLRRVVERSRALARDAGGLPVVVVVEAAEPAIGVDRHVEVHLVARRAELRRLLAMERLEERLAVRLRIDVEQLIVRELQQRVLARRQVVQRRILDDEVALSHRALDVRDRVARRAGEAGLRFRRVDLLLDRPIEPSVEEHRVIVTAGAPLRRLRADDVLHVLDRFAVPLVVERREVVHRRVPLIVDVLVAAAARRAGQEEVRRE